MRELLLNIEQAVKAQGVHYPNHKPSAIPKNIGRYSNKPNWNARLPTRRENQANAGGLSAVKRETYWNDY
jgi:hypothetical protein